MPEAGRSLEIQSHALQHEVAEHFIYRHRGDFLLKLGNGKEKSEKTEEQKKAKEI